MKVTYRTIPNLAWLDSNCAGPNEHCRRAAKAGKRVHIIPHFQDPRAVEFTLALREYHFATEAEALAALEEAWKTAPAVFTFPERDAAYARGGPVKISRNIVANSAAIGIGIPDAR